MGTGGCRDITDAALGSIRAGVWWSLRTSDVLGIYDALAIGNVGLLDRTSHIQRCGGNGRRLSPN